MGTLEKRGIKFLDKRLNGRNYKIGTSTTEDFDISFISAFENPETIAEIISNIDKAINNQFDLIRDPDISNNTEIAFITPNGIDFYDVNGQNIIGHCPLQDFKDIAEAWRAFLLQPPFIGDTSGLRF